MRRRKVPCAGLCPTVVPALVWINECVPFMLS